MKLLTFGIFLLLLIGSLIAYRHYGNHRDSMVSNTITEKAPAPDWVPTDAELGNRNQGVGWVFGRMSALPMRQAVQTIHRLEPICPDGRRGTLGREVALKQLFILRLPDSCVRILTSRRHS
jgi:hypothetical protein